MNGHVADRRLHSAGADSVEVARPSFEDYLVEMSPAIQRVARKRSGNHPFLSQEDLFQEGMTALWRVWEVYCNRHPMDDLCKIGFVAARNQIASVRRRIFKSGESFINWVDIDGLLKYNDADGVKEVVDILFVRQAIRAADSILSGMAKMVLGEILTPSEKTIQAVRKLWINRQKINVPWFRVEPFVYSEALDVPLPDVRRALREIRRQFVVQLTTAQEAGRFYSVGDNLTEGGDNMDQKGFTPDPADFDLPGETVTRPPVTKPAAPPKAEGKGNSKEKSTEKSTAKATAKPKAEAKVKAKAKATTKAKVKATTKAKVKATTKPKAKEKTKAVARKLGDFRPGTQAERVWNALLAKFAKTKSLKLNDIIEVYTKLGKKAGDARNSASLFSWDLVRKGLVKRVGSGDLVRK